MEVSYADLLAGRQRLEEVVRPGDVVRIESPGRDWEVEKAILLLGTDEEDDESYDRLSRGAVGALTFDRGEILCPRQWYLGYRRALRRIEEQLAACPHHLLLNAPAEIAVMFDKPACHVRLRDRGVPVPRSLGVVGSYAELRERMAAEGCRRVFVKLAHGSSASGVVAYETDGRRHQAFTTAEAVRSRGALHLYNSRRVRRYRDTLEIAEIVDALCRHHVHVEEWLPKAGVEGKAADLRVVVIAGRARHTVVRRSRGPITNLHLLNERADAEALRGRMTETAWAALRTTCERAAACFPATLYCGLDVLVTPDLHHHAVLEVNAFGDLLPGLCDGGEDTYEAEIRAALSSDVTEEQHAVGAAA